MPQKNQLPGDYNAYCEGRELSDDEALEHERVSNKLPLALTVRIKLLGYYERKRHRDVAQIEKYFVTALWFVENQPNVSDRLWHIVGRCAYSLPPRDFALARAMWLTHIDKAPQNAILIGRAGMFIVIRDIETGAHLIRTAQNLAPTNSHYPGWLAIHSYFEFDRVAPRYKKRYASLTVAEGAKALALETTSVWQILEYMVDCLIFLNDLAAAKHYLIPFIESDLARNRQTAEAFNGLIALKEGDFKTAIECMMSIKKGYMPHERIWQLAAALFRAGERKSIISCIRQYKNKLRASVRSKWILDIEDGRQPNFDRF